MASEPLRGTIHFTHHHPGGPDLADLAGPPPTTGIEPHPIASNFDQSEFENLVLNIVLRTYFINPEAELNIPELYQQLLAMYTNSVSNDYSLEEIYLIRKPGGDLIAHCQRLANNHELDSDLIAGMLTAIQTFIRDCFELGEHEELTLMRMGTRRIMIEHSEHLFIALVFSGPAMFPLRRELHTVLETLETKYNDRITDLAPSPELLEELNPIFAPLFSLPPRQTPSSTPPELSVGPSMDPAGVLSIRPPPSDRL